MYELMWNHPNSLFAQFERLRRELDDAFVSSGPPSGIRAVAPGTAPAVNVGRTSRSIEVQAHVPGLDAAKIEVTLDRGVLRIAGERAAAIPAGDPKVQVYASERGSGRFARAITLPDDVDPTRVKASYRDGVLQVSIARREAAQAQRIVVQ